MASGTGSKFLYFAFGSNMCTKRIHINNPSAVFKHVAVVEGYKLFFGYSDSNRWRGEVATIVEETGANVHGIIWELDKDHQVTLDKQEGVPTVYQRIEVQARPLGRSSSNKNSEKLTCVSYQLLPENLVNAKNLPSKVYKNVLLTGAKEHSMPDFYIEKLENHPDNGYDGEVDVKLDL